MKKILAITTFLSIFLGIFSFSISSKAKTDICTSLNSNDPSKQYSQPEKKMIQVRIIDPINISSTDEKELYWTGTCCTVITGIEDNNKDIKFKDCRVVDMEYTESPDGCTKAPETPPIEGTYTLVGQCKLVQIIKASTGIGLLKIFIGKIYTWGATLGGIVSVLLIIISGIQYITAGGDSNKTTEAKARIIQSLMALAVLLLSGLILYTINPNFFVPG